LFLPAFGDAEQEWPNTLRGVLYLLGLLYCFAGVAIIADIFMAAIEKITSKKVTIKDPKLGGKPRTVTVWNGTVANLSLMALGSSAPEILLNVIGIFPTFLSGPLGPSTIVGSAAFNLLMIIAVCVVAIPNGESRSIKYMGVFGVTAFFSVFAYIWLLFMLLLISPDVVEWWEGVLTFVFFWVLVVLAFVADKRGAGPPSYVLDPLNSNEELSDMEFQVREQYGKYKDLTEEQVTCLIHYKFAAPVSKAVRRVSATRDFTGGKLVCTRAKTKFEIGKELNDQLMVEPKPEAIGNDMSYVQLSALNYAVKESAGSVDVVIEAKGKALTRPIQVSYETQDGTALKGSDYTAVKDTVTLGPTKTSEVVKVPIEKGDGQYEGTECFYIMLQEPSPDKGFALGKQKKAAIYIIDEDNPGVLCFDKERMEIVPAGSAALKVQVRLYTEDAEAVKGKDFEGFDYTVELGPYETTKSVPFKVMPNAGTERTETFRIYMSEATGGATFDPSTDGGAECCVCTVVLKGDEAPRSKVKALVDALKMNEDVLALGHASYVEQFRSAVYVGGSPEAQKDASKIETVCHYVTLPFKIIFATTPPVEYCGGWLCFFVALGYVGIVTCIIGDMAELLGCVWGISESTTAITLVAVGTSLPDTFASMNAAKQDEYADNSIGNVTGSNSVNVFLGLGLPWMICAIFWTFVASCEAGDGFHTRFPAEALQYPTGAFVVKAGSLGFSVAIFTACAITCITTLVVRRVKLGGELGGNRKFAWATTVFFMGLWVVYIVASITNE